MTTRVPDSSEKEFKKPSDAAGTSAAPVGHGGRKWYQYIPIISDLVEWRTNSLAQKEMDKNYEQARKNESEFRSGTAVVQKYSDMQTLIPSTAQDSIIKIYERLVSEGHMLAKAALLSLYSEGLKTTDGKEIVLQKKDEFEQVNALFKEIDAIPLEQLIKLGIPPEHLHSYLKKLFEEILRYQSQVDATTSPSWTKSLEMNHAALKMFGDFAYKAFIILKEIPVSPSAQTKREALSKALQEAYERADILRAQTLDLAEKNRKFSELINNTAIAIRPYLLLPS